MIGETGFAAGLGGEGQPFALHFAEGVGRDHPVVVDLPGGEALHVLFDLDPGFAGAERFSRGEGTVIRADEGTAIGEIFRLTEVLETIRAGATERVDVR